MSKTIIIFGVLLGLFFPKDLVSQSLELLAELPSMVHESSGIIASGEDKFWTFNDSEGEPELYQFDLKGNQIRTLKIFNAWNRDWEDICRDDKGRVYIGNIGNNANTNTDLRIFVIPDPDKVSEEAVFAEVISFSYEDQTAFPPSSDSMNFDCEAMIWLNNNIYLFTKHRSPPWATNVYRIPARSGHHTARKIRTFLTGEAKAYENEPADYWITAADVSPDKGKVCLLSHNKLWVFYDFTGDDFFGGKSKIYEFDESTQKEAVCFINNEELFITDEYQFIFRRGGNLYRFKIDPED